MMPKIDIASVPERTGSNYPAPFAEQAGERIKLALGSAGNLQDFGVNLTTLPPGAWSSQRHWHSHEDEFVYILSGDVVLVTDAGEEILHPHDCAAFPKNVANGHQLVNRGTVNAVYLEIGSRHADDTCTYPDVDLHAPAGDAGYTHKDGSPY
jgi:uncharacterized cupin superfamily protein